MRFQRTLTALLAAAALTALPAGPAEAKPVLAPQAAPATTGSPDFDGDGKADVATSIKPDIGVSALRIHYGSGSTATFTAQEVARSAEARLPGPILARDLNADGYTDLALTASTDLNREVRIVCLLFGSATGLQLSTLHTIAAPSDDRRTDFGASLALVEAPLRRLAVGYVVGHGANAVAVYALGSDGSPTGDPQVLTPGSGGIPATADYFGLALASSGNQLFVGAPVSKVGKVYRAGAVIALTFGETGVTHTQVVTQSNAGVAGAAQDGDHFGYSLAARDAYLAVGTPGDRVGAVKDTGSVQVFRIAKGTLTPVKRLSQSSSGVPGRSEKHDGFGRSVALGTVCTGVTGVVVGGPGEVLTSRRLWEGSVWVIPLKLKSSCKARQLYLGHSLPGRPADSMYLGSDVGVVRDKGAALDTVVIGGSGDDEHQDGRLITWSNRTHKTLSYLRESVSGIGGR